MFIQKDLAQNALHLVGVEELRKRWAWFVGVGIVLMVLGLIAVGSSSLTTLMTLVTMKFIGWLMVIGGVLEFFHGFTSRKHGVSFVEFFAGILYTVFGLVIVFHPTAAAVGLTFFISVLLILGGCFRIAVAITTRFHHRFWLFFHGLINLVLGYIILDEWPISGLWVIGLFIGIDMIFNGWELIVLGLMARRIPVEASPAETHPSPRTP